MAVRLYAVLASYRNHPLKRGRLNSWPGSLSPGDLLELPDVAGHFLLLLTTKPKKVRRIRAENGFEAWQRLLKEMQPATRARSLALWTQFSRVQFAEGKTISEQLPQYETIITEYERISGHTYADDARVASILQAVPPRLRAHLQLLISDDTTYEQVM